MTTTRKPRPAYLTRAEAEAMIAVAAAGERERSERAMMAAMLAIGGTGQAMGEMADALADAGRTLDLHDGLLRSMSEVVAAGLDLTAADEAPASSPN